MVMRAILRKDIQEAVASINDTLLLLDEEGVRLENGGKFLKKLLDIDENYLDAAKTLSYLEDIRFYTEQIRATAERLRARG